MIKKNSFFVYTILNFALFILQFELNDTISNPQNLGYL
jgi:hypothetical protein